MEIGYRQACRIVQWPSNGKCCHGRPRSQSTGPAMRVRQFQSHWHGRRSCQVHNLPSQAFAAGYCTVKVPIDCQPVLFPSEPSRAAR